LIKETIYNELQFKAVRSSGAGGQHVNKVATKIELSFDLCNSKALTHHQKSRLLEKLENKLTKTCFLLMQCDETRSQHKNKELVLKRFLELLTNALKVPKRRKPTKPSKASIEKRLQSKQKKASKKAIRRKPNLD